MKRFLLITAAAATGLVVLMVSLFMARTVLRYYALRKVLNSPEARHRLSVMPIERTIIPLSPTRAVNLGYATFDPGTTDPVALQLADSMGTWVFFTNRSCQILFLAPFSNKISLGLPPVGKKLKADLGYSSLPTHLENLQSDPISEFIEIERTTVLPFSKVILMTRDHFKAYEFFVGQKASLAIGQSGVYFFTNDHLKGLSRIGRISDDRKRAFVILAATHYNLNVGFDFVLSSSTTNDLVHTLDPILNSFRFTMAAPVDIGKVRELIAAAGISRN